MNKYKIIFEHDGQRFEKMVDAETVVLAEQQIAADADIIDIKFVRALSFSCRIRGSSSRLR